MAKGRFKSIDGVCKRLKTDLDAPCKIENPDRKRVSILYACNASGKTRLSKLFYDKYRGKVLYYNAFTEDLFNWDNEYYILNFDKNAWIFKLIEEQGLDRQIIDNFQKFTGSKLEPNFDISKGEIIFGIRSGDDETSENIKISRGEESVFIWSIYYTVLETAIDALNETVDDRSTDVFNKIEYIVIDDPVSSMDDTRIITIALDLIRLISESKSRLKFLIMTHYALFFNVLFNARKSNWDKRSYILSKSDTDILLKPQGNDSPFAYHHAVISEIEKAMKKDDIKKYHFNLFRALLEKTANFLGLSHWKKCLAGGDHGDEFTKLIDHYSHNRLSDLEYKDVTKEEKDEFAISFRNFMQEFKWGVNNDV